MLRHFTVRDVKECLSENFPKAVVIFDIPPGVGFRHKIERALTSSDLLEYRYWDDTATQKMVVFVPPHKSADTIRTLAATISDAVYTIVV